MVPLVASPERAALPHDLLEFVPSDAIAADDEIPGWARERLARAPFVVVRRARSREGMLPVGVRGSMRHERFAGWLSPSAVRTRTRPERLVRRAAWRSTPRASSVAHFAALERIAAIMSALDLAWGPGGSVGYELVSGIASVTPASDIDVIVRAPNALSRCTARLLIAELHALPIRTDVQIETPRGAVALAEYAGDAKRVALRTLDGPRLVTDPWACEDGARSLL